MWENEKICSVHPERKAVISCRRLGTAFCAECRENAEMRSGFCGYCPNKGHCAIQRFYLAREANPGVLASLEDTTRTGFIEKPAINQSHPLPLHSEHYGQGLPLIILHGLFGSGRNWISVCRNLGDSCSVYAPDLRNHGDSPHSDVFDYESMVEDVKFFMDRHQLKAAAILGHSLGGKVAMALAARYPEYVQKLVIVDIAPKAYLQGPIDIASRLVKTDIKSFRNLHEISNALQTNIPSPKIRQFLLKNLYRNGEGHYTWKINLNAINKHRISINRCPDLSGGYPGDTLFIRGGLSDFIKKDDREKIKNIFSNAVIITLKDAGHWVHIDVPQAFTEVVKTFILADRFGG